MKKGREDKWNGTKSSSSYSNNLNRSSNINRIHINNRNLLNHRNINHRSISHRSNMSSNSPTKANNMFTLNS